MDEERLLMRAASISLTSMEALKARSRAMFRNSRQNSLSKLTDVLRPRTTTDRRSTEEPATFRSLFFENLARGLESTCHRDISLGFSKSAGLLHFSHMQQAETSSVVTAKRRKRTTTASDGDLGEIE